MTETRCMGCGTFFDKKEQVCPFCGKPRAAFNKHLRTAKLNENLYRQIARAKETA